jgi:hypothetical protein
MKRLLLLALAGAIIFIALSCQTIDPNKKYPNMVADADPVSVGVIEVQFDRFLSSKVNKNEVEVIFYPRLNAVALEFRYELIKTRQFWDAAGRRQFAEALEQYKSDYAERKLTDRYRRTRAVYGKVSGRTEWETFRFGKNRVAYPVIELGYRFKEEMPFFTTLMWTAREVDEQSNDSSLSNSQQINMYFTRAQAEEAVRLFDQSYLMSLLGKKDQPEPETEEPVAGDSYREYGGRN